MKIEVRNLMSAGRVGPRALFTALALALCLAPAVSQAGGGHQFFNNEPETLEYPGPARFWNTAGIVISPTRIIAQVNTEVPMFAGVCDGKGHLLAYEKVEWMLDKASVGSFVTVSDAYRPFLLELVSSKPHKIDNSYAVSETLPANVILTRGTPNISDDMVMPHGYTWVTVTAAHEGVSYVTAFAPDVHGWDARQRSATIHWIDAEWQFPEPGCVPLGSRASLNTCVYRKTNKTPLADWIVKYTVTGGAPAGFGEKLECSTEVATDKQGISSVELVPAGETAGMTCVCVELIRSECAAIGDPERLSIASSAMYVNWGAKADELDCSANASPVPAPAPTIAPGPAPQPATPPAYTPNSNQAVVPPAIPPTTKVPSTPPPAVPQIALDVSGPETAEPGTDIRFIINVANRGTAPVSNLVLIDRYDAGLQHSEHQNPLQNVLTGTLAPGQSRQIGITFRVIRPGRLCHTVEITGQGVHEVKQMCVNVTAPPPPPEKPSMELHISTPDDQRIRHVGDQVDFTIEVRNTGPIPAQQVQLSVKLEAGLHMDFVTSDAKLRNDGSYVYVFDSIPPSSVVTRKITTSCVAAVQRACAIVDSVDLSKQQFREEACVTILPLQAGAGGPLRLSVATQRNPIKIGAEAIYRVTVTNAGNEPQRQVQLTIEVPENMSFVAVQQSPTNASIDGQKVQFSAIQELRAHEPQNFDVRLRAVRAGSAKVVAQLNVNQREQLTGNADANVVD